MTMAEQLRASRSKHTLKSYDDAVRQLRVFRAVTPITWRKSESSANTPKSEISYYGFGQKK